MNRTGSGAPDGKPGRKPGRKPGAPRRGSASSSAVRAPCCGLPSPLASAIRVTVTARPAPAAATEIEIEIEPGARQPQDALG